MEKEHKTNNPLGISHRFEFLIPPSMVVANRLTIRPIRFVCHHSKCDELLAKIPRMVVGRVGFCNNASNNPYLNLVASTWSASWWTLVYILFVYWFTRFLCNVTTLCSFSGSRWLSPRETPYHKQGRLRVWWLFAWLWYAGKGPDWRGLMVFAGTEAVLFFN